MFTLSFYRFLSSNTKQINLISDVSIMKHPLRKLRNTEIHRISWALVLLCKYVLCCLDKQWYDRFSIYIITYNITPVLSIIAWNLSETVILFTLIVIGQLSVFLVKIFDNLTKCEQLNRTYSLHSFGLIIWLFWVDISDTQKQLFDTYQTYINTINFLK